MMLISKSLFFTLCVLLLCSCGGGGSPETSPHSTPQATSCVLPMQYANGANSGKPITGSLTLTEPRLLNCNITQTQSASVSICIDHKNIAELTSQLFLNDTQIATLDLQSATASSNACLLSGSLYTVSLPMPMTQLNGNWKVGVIDNDQVASTPLGYLVGWSLRVDGTQ